MPKKPQAVLHDGGSPGGGEGGEGGGVGEGGGEYGGAPKQQFSHAQWPTAS